MPGDTNVLAKTPSSHMDIEFLYKLNESRQTSKIPERPGKGYSQQDTPLMKYD